MRSVIEYRSQQQRIILQNLWDALRSIAGEVLGFLQAVRNRLPGPALIQFLLLGVLGLATLTLLGLALWKLFQWVGYRTTTEAPLPRAPFYRDLLKTLGSLGLERPAHVTPQEFVEKVEAEISPRAEEPGRFLQAVRYLTDQFYRVRFGDRSLDTSQRERIRAELKYLKSCRVPAAQTEDGQHSS
jgi:hypothetical protein